MKRTTRLGRTSVVIIASCALLSGFAAQQHPAAVEFIHISDTHVTDLRGVAAPIVKQRAHLVDSERRLAALLTDTGRQGRASFAVITGDLSDAFSYRGVDGKPIRSPMEAFRRATAHSQIGLFLTLGNHDIQHYEVAADGEKLAGDQSVAGAARAAWIRTADCFRNGTYYEFSKQAGATRYVFLMLDNGYLATGATNPPREHMGHEQLYWLHQRVTANNDAVLILAMHIPIGTDATSETIRNSVASAPNIALVLAGHNHRDQIDDLNLGASNAVQVRTASLGLGAQNWRRIRLLPDRIEIYKTGRQDQLERTIPIAARVNKPAA